MLSPEDQQHAVLIAAAAGRGSRLDPMASGRPKPLVQVAGQPILHWGLTSFDPRPLAAAAVVTRPGWMERTLEVAAKALPHVPLVGVEQSQPSGTLDALKLGLQALAHADRHLGAEAAVLFLHGDNIPPRQASARALDRLTGWDAIILSRRAVRPGSSARVERKADGRAVELQKETDRESGSEGDSVMEDRGGGASPVEVSTGLFAYGGWIWRELEQTLAAFELPAGERRIDELNNHLIASGRAEVMLIEGPWIHINTADDLVEAERILGV